MEEYEIQISRADVEILINNATAKKKDDKKKVNLVGEFMHIFEKKIFEVEKLKIAEPFRIKKKNYYCYTAETRDGAPLIHIDGTCVSCNANGIKNKYVINIYQLNQTEDLFYQAHVKRYVEHEHAKPDPVDDVDTEHQDNKTEQLRGDRRKEIGQLLLSQSAEQVRDMLLANDKPSASLEVLRRIKHEARVESLPCAEDVAKCMQIDWYGRLYTCANSFYVADMEAKKTRGFIQSIGSFKEFSMILYLKEKLECIHAVPVKDRIAHFDATGELVAIAQRYSAADGTFYHRFLNYFLLLRPLEAKVSAMVAELVTTRLDVYVLSQFFEIMSF